MRLIQQRDRARPMFLYVPFNAPHGPLQVPQRLIDKYAALPERRRKVYAAMVDSLDTASGVFCKHSTVRV